MFSVWCDICTWVCYKFPTESNYERILKIGEYLVKLWARVRCLVFWLTVYRPISRWHGAQQPTCWNGVWMMGWIDRHTPDSFIDPAPLTTWAVSIRGITTLCRKHNKQVCDQPATAAANVTLLAFAADRRAAVAPFLWRSIPPGPQQPIRRTLLQTSIAGTDR